MLPQRRGVEISVAAQALWLAGLAGLFLLHRLRVAERWGRAVPASALALVVAYWGGLAVLHARALGQARAAAQTLAAPRQEGVLRVAAMPSLANPFRWRCVAETDGALHRFDLSVFGAGDGADAWGVEHFEKPRGAEAEAVARAGADERAEIFLDFSRFPATRVVRGCGAETLVRFADLRFAEPDDAPRRGSFTLEIPAR